MKELFYVHLTVAVFFIGFNTYFAYMGNYLIYYLGFTADKMGIIEAVPLVLAMLSAIPVSKLINSNKHVPVVLSAIVINAAGQLILAPLRPDSVDVSKIFNLQLLLGIFVLGVGYIAFLQTTKIWAKRLFPKDSRGQFEGIWVLFFVLIPMIGGSLIGQAVVQTSGETFLNAESGRMEYIPNGNIFVAGTIIVLLALIPAILAARAERK
jgi:predicted MFS family arabinose efflux permease